QCPVDPRCHPRDVARLDVDRDDLGDVAAACGGEFDVAGHGGADFELLAGDVVLEQGDAHDASPSTRSQVRVKLSGCTARPRSKSAMKALTSTGSCARIRWPQLPVATA